VELKACLGSDDKERNIEKLHEDNCHPGIINTVKTLKRFLKLSYLYKKVKESIRKCKVC
jgi:hypothetical protein